MVDTFLANKTLDYTLQYEATAPRHPIRHAPRISVAQLMTASSFISGTQILLILEIIRPSSIR